MLCDSAACVINTSRFVHVYRLIVPPLRLHAAPADSLTCSARPSQSASRVPPLPFRLFETLDFGRRTSTERQCVVFSVSFTTGHNASCLRNSERDTTDRPPTVSAETANRIERSLLVSVKDSHHCVRDPRCWV